MAQQSFHPVVGRAWGHWLLRLHRIVENPIAVGILFPLSQQLRCAGRQDDGAGSGVGFRLSNADAAAFFIENRAADLQPSANTVEVLPPQSADFSPPHSRGQLRIEEVKPVWILLDSLHETLQLRLRQDLLWRVICLGDHRSLRGIFHDQSLPHRRVHSLMEHHVDAPNHAVRQTIALLVVFLHPSVFPEVLYIFCTSAVVTALIFISPSRGLT